MYQFEFQYSVEYFVLHSKIYLPLQSFSKFQKYHRCTGKYIRLYHYYSWPRCVYTKTIAEEVPIDFLNKNREFILKFSFSMCFDGSDYDE